MSRQLDYLGTRPCGCAPAWCSGDLPLREVARAVAQMIRDGLNVERVTTEESRHRVGFCAVHQRQRPEQQEELFTMGRPS